MIEPTTPSGWVVGDGRPSPKRRWVVGTLIAAVVVVAVVIFVIARTSFGQGFTAAIAIYDHGRPEVVRANYYESTNQPATMQVFLASGVDPSLARGVGCDLVRSELAKAGLPDLHWVVYAASGEPIVDSATATC